MQSNIICLASNIFITVHTLPELRSKWQSVFPIVMVIFCRTIEKDIFCRTILQNDWGFHHCNIVFVRWVTFRIIMFIVIYEIYVLTFWLFYSFRIFNIINASILSRVFWIIQFFRHNFVKWLSRPQSLPFLPVAGQTCQCVRVQFWSKCCSIECVSAWLVCGLFKHSRREFGWIVVLHWLCC